MDGAKRRVALTRTVSEQLHELSRCQDLDFPKRRDIKEVVISGDDHLSVAVDRDL